MTYVRTPPYLYEHQADATLNQANPVSATPYTVLATTEKVRIISITAQVTWTVQPNLQIIVTIDGQTIIYTINAPATATDYEAQQESQAAPANQILQPAGAFLPGRAFMLEGRSVRVQAVTTGGTTTNLTARVKYAKIP